MVPPAFAAEAASRRCNGRTRLTYGSRLPLHERRFPDRERRRGFTRRHHRLSPNGDSLQKPDPVTDLRARLLRVLDRTQNLSIDYTFPKSKVKQQQPGRTRLLANPPTAPIAGQMTKRMIRRTTATRYRENAASNRFPTYLTFSPSPFILSTGITRSIKADTRIDFHGLALTAPATRIHSTERRTPEGVMPSRRYTHQERTCGWTSSRSAANIPLHAK